MTNQTLSPRSAPTPDHEPGAPQRSGRVSRFLSSHPRRSLLAVFLFVLVAGFFGGPLAGSLDASGGFASDDAVVAKIETRAPSQPRPTAEVVRAACAELEPIESVDELIEVLGQRLATTPTTFTDTQPLSA